MAAVQQSLEALHELQELVSRSLQGQLGVLREARAGHSHSDILLPPDLAASVLSSGSLHLKSQVDSHIKSSFSNKEQRDNAKPAITSSLFGFEARKLVFQVFQGAGEEQELENEGAKDLFDRLDVILSLETQGMYGDDKLAFQPFLRVA
jgi:hypothetical protein